MYVDEMSEKFDNTFKATKDYKFPVYYFSKRTELGRKIYLTKL